MFDSLSVFFLYKDCIKQVILILSIMINFNVPQICYEYLKICHTWWTLVGLYRLSSPEVSHCSIKWIKYTIHNIQFGKGVVLDFLYVFGPTAWTVKALPGGSKMNGNGMEYKW